MLYLNEDSSITITPYVYVIQVLVLLCITPLCFGFATLMGTMCCSVGTTAFDAWDTILISAHAFVGAWYMYKLTEPLRSYPSKRS